MTEYRQETAETSHLDLRSYSAGTDKPLVIRADSFSIGYLGPGTLLDPMHPLQGFLFVQLKASRRGILASTFLEAEEYGWGESQHAAIMDLGSSLIEYMGSLESRKAKLSDRALADLAALHALFGILS